MSNKISEAAEEEIYYTAQQFGLWAEIESFLYDNGHIPKKNSVTEKNCIQKLLTLDVWMIAMFACLYHKNGEKLTTRRAAKIIAGKQDNASITSAIQRVTRYLEKIKHFEILRHTEIQYHNKSKIQARYIEPTDLLIQFFNRRSKSKP